MYLKKIVKINVYDMYLKIVLCDDIEEYNKKSHLKSDLESLDESVLGFEMIYGEKINKIQYWVTEIVINPNHERFNTGIIVHESVHAGLDIFNTLGMSRIYDDQEPLSYLVEFIFKEVYKFYNKK